MGSDTTARSEAVLGASAEKPPKAWWIAGAALAIVGAIAFGVQMANQTMAGASQYPWGFYIAMFYAAASAGAGLLVVAGFARWMDCLSDRTMTRLYAIACALLVGASVLIVVDLGNPLAIMLTYASANPASPVFFDAVILPLCIVFALAAALTPKKSETVARVFALVGIIVGFALLGIEAWLLTTCSGKDAWGVLLGAAPALVQAATLGIAVVVLTQPSGRAWRALLGGITLVMAASLVFDVVLNQNAATVLGSQLSAIAATPLFWVAAACACAGAAIALVSGKAQPVRVSATCAILSVPLFKLAIFQGTQSVVAIDELEAAGAFAFQPMELVVALGAVGVGVLAFAVLTAARAALEARARRSAAAPASTTAAAAAPASPGVPAAAIPSPADDQEVQAL